MRRLLLLATLLGAASLPAQQPLVSRALDSATVVRLLPVRGAAFQGVLLAPLRPDAERIVFAPPAHRDCGVPRVLCRLELPVADVRAVEVRQGSRLGRGALIGAGVGIFAGFALGLHLPEADCVLSVGGGCGGPSHAADVAVMTLLSGALGTGIGALFGLGSPTWERAP